MIYSFLDNQSLFRVVSLSKAEQKLVSGSPFIGERTYKTSLCRLAALPEMNLLQKVCSHLVLKDVKVGCTCGCLKNDGIIQMIKSRIDLLNTEVPMISWEASDQIGNGTRSVNIYKFLSTLFYIFGSQHVYKSISIRSNERNASTDLSVFLQSFRTRELKLINFKVQLNSLNSDALESLILFQTELVTSDQPQEIFNRKLSLSKLIIDGSFTREVCTLFDNLESSSLQKLCLRFSNASFFN